MEINKYKHALVFGLARSGAAVANLLDSAGVNVTVTDKKSIGELGCHPGALRPGIKIKTGEFPEDMLEKCDLIVISPGVPTGNTHIRKALEKGIKVIGELEVAYLIIKELIPCQEFYAVTGTNGKSTTVSLLNALLKDSGRHTILSGNIGNAVSEEIYQGYYLEGSDVLKQSSVTPVHFVTEISSFQLETVEQFKPKGSAILNVTPDHLDRYSSFTEYRDAKCRIFMNQSHGDFLVLNADDPDTNEIRKKVKGPHIFYFSLRERVEGAFYSNGYIYFNMPEGMISPQFRLKTSDFGIKGIHNIENAMAASLMALLTGADEHSVEKTLRKFSGLKHRLEFVEEIEGVGFINDSKGTNVGAVIKSLESFDSPVILIAGGKDKGGDFSKLRDAIKNRVKALVLIGEASSKINKAVGDLAEVYMESDIYGAVHRSGDLASPGDTVLLSPACASFDMFKDFEERGSAFTEAVQRLKC